MPNSVEQNINEFLDIEILNKLPSLDVKARYLVEGFLKGLHKSPFRGSSVEFKEYRSYQPGDSLKLIDWKVYGRTDRLNIRLRDDETNMNVYLLLDSSASMSYKGEKSAMSKWDYSISLAAALMLFLMKQNDAFTLSLVANHLKDFLRPSSKRSHFNTLLSRLCLQPNDQNCDLPKAISELCGVVRRRSIVIIISDFYGDLKVLNNQLKELAYLNCEPIFFNVMDNSELNFDFDEPVLLSDLESGSKLHLSPEVVRKKYLENLNAHLLELERIVSSVGGEYLLLNTSIPPLKALGKYLYVRSEKFK
ncbi:DUF58 domain-containing protein [Lentisphaerota bacterium WC36G]|nr:DUF58 domain-containing protein [Lentisphaerae bacterium WC36]